MSGVPQQPHRPRASPWPFAGMIGMACVFFLVAASGLVVPWYVVAALLALWALVLVVASAWWSSHPTWLPWLPVGLAGVWFSTVVGGAVLGAWD